MPTLVRVLLIVSAMLGAFCWWGTSSAAGQRQFDEMAGMIPFFAGIFGLILLAAALLYLVISRRKSGAPPS